MAHVRKQCISLFLTAKCNLRCRYCYTMKSAELREEHHSLNLEFAKTGIDDFFREYPSRHIRFYGAGEPTQEFELMQEITNYAHSKAGDDLVVELQTNGVFSKRVAEWIEHNVHILWISADGPADIHDWNRPTAGGGSSVGPVSANIQYFVKAAATNKMQVGVRATITPNAMHRQQEIVEYFGSLGVKYVNAHPSTAAIDDDGDPLFSWQPEEFAFHYLAAHNRGREIGVFYNSLYIANFDERTRHFCRANVPYPHLTTDGYVSCCDFAQFGPEYDTGPLQLLVYGRYIPEEQRIEYDEDKIYQIRRRNADNLVSGKLNDNCGGCKLAYHCGGGCVGQAVLQSGNLSGVHEGNCAITRYLGARMPLCQGLNPVLHS